MMTQCDYRLAASSSSPPHGLPASTVHAAMLAGHALYIDTPVLVCASNRLQQPQGTGAEKHPARPRGNDTTASRLHALVRTR